MEQTLAALPVASDGKNGASVKFTTSQGVEMQSTPVRLAPQEIVFEIPGPVVGLRVSEVLTDFKVLLPEQCLFSGVAVVNSLIRMGASTLCEATLKNAALDLQLLQGDKLEPFLQGAFKTFMEGWKKQYRILPEYKLIAADMHTFLSDLRLWVEQLELGIRASPSEDRAELERRIGNVLSQLAHPVLDMLFEKLEGVTSKLPSDVRGIHRSYINRLLHPFLLSSPFAYRCVTKPLGYAGDYEVVNMILRDPHEGASLFGKIMNRWFIKQPPALAHRNRVKWLKEKLVQETARLVRRGETARIFNLGCGPAKEVQDFMNESSLSDHAHFTLLDFNEETLTYAKSCMSTALRRSQRRTSLEFVKKSVAQVLRGRDRRTESTGRKYDLVYCAGLFDYLEDSTCKQLMNIFYDWLAPGGLLIATNVDSGNPIQHWLGDVLEWQLIYRNGREFQELAPDAAEPELVSVSAEDSGVNIFLEVRRPMA